MRLNKYLKKPKFILTAAIKLNNYAQVTSVPRGLF
jgi:hypothetical protein